MTQETRTCQNCKQAFIIDAQDFAFYDKMQVPPPTFCPRCRLQRRLAWRNERGLHRRNCDFCGKSIIAMYQSGTPFPVYCRPCWYSDAWDPLRYGRNYDFSRSFFEQFRELEHAVPHIALQVDNCINCEYANQIADCKNCYLITGGSKNEDSMYSYRLHESRNICDVYLSLKNEYLYECIECLGSSRLLFSEDCMDSLDLLFCYDVRGGNNAFMSSNLRRASYVFRGERLSKDAYHRKLREIDTGSFAVWEKLREEFREMKRRSLHKFANAKQAVNTTGYSMTNTKNCHWCFNVADLENCRYCLLLNNAKDAMDINNGCCAFEMAYEVSTGGVKSSYVMLSADCWPEVSHVTYCNTCRNGASNLFGCISLRKKSHCILNRQYSKEAYEALLPKIYAHMNEMPYTDSKGRTYRYGEFFPAELSPFPYNDSAAMDYFPLTKESALAVGLLWHDAETKSYQITLYAAELPDNIRDTPDSVTKEVIGCRHGGTCDEWCTTAFRVIPEELALYRKMQVPIPRLCPNCRHTRRLRERNPLNLWQRTCACAGAASHDGMYKNTISHSHGTPPAGGPCQEEFETSYAPDRLEIVYCEACYNAEVA